MTKLYTAVLMLLGFVCTAFAQAPQGINYQAVVRDAAGYEVVNSTVVFRFTIHDSLATGHNVFTETDTVTTNQLGVATVQIGSAGNPPFTALSVVNWNSGNKYLQVEVAVSPASAFTDMGRTQLLSVPYALSAANGLAPGNSAGQMLYWNGSAWVKVAPGPNCSVLSFYNGVPVWIPSQFYIGQHYGGGVIFYLDSTCQHGLIAAAADQNSGTNWYNNGTDILCNATGTALFTGAANTDSIIKYQGTGSYAASIARNYNGGGYSDWYLPSNDELNLLYQYRNVIGGFSTNFYWSSSEYDLYNAWYIDFLFYDGYAQKSNFYYVRAIRAF